MVKLGFNDIVAEMLTDFIIVMVIFDMQKYDHNGYIYIFSAKRLNGVGSGGGGLLLLLLGVGGGGGGL